MGFPLKETVAKGNEPSRCIIIREYFESNPAKKKHGYEINSIFPVTTEIIPITSIVETA
jgi:hypothetical protein